MRRLVWLLMTSSLAAVLFLIVTFVAQGRPLDNILLGFFGIMFVVLFSALTYSKKLLDKKGYFIFLAAILVSSGVVLAGLHAGLFESIVLLDDSYIDVSNCAVVLHIKNVGLTDWQLTKLTLGDVLADLSSQPRLTSRGESKYVVVYYAYRRFQWYGEEFFSAWESPYLVSGSYNSSVHVNPLTFTNGSKYPVSLLTRGMLNHNFELEAKITRNETVDYSARIFNLRQTNDNYCLFDLTIDGTRTSVFYLYSIQIGDFTLLFNRPQRIPHWGATVFSIYLKNFETSATAYTNIVDLTLTSNPPITASTFRIGETYNVTLRTMTNNNYTTTITIQQ